MASDRSRRKYLRALRKSGKATPEQLAELKALQAKLEENPAPKGRPPKHKNGASAPPTSAGPPPLNVKVLKASPGAGPGSTPPPGPGASAGATEGSKYSPAELQNMGEVMYSAALTQLNHFVVREGGFDMTGFIRMGATCFGLCCVRYPWLVDHTLRPEVGAAVPAIAVGAQAAVLFAKKRRKKADEEKAKNAKPAQPTAAPQAAAPPPKAPPPPPGARADDGDPGPIVRPREVGIDGAGGGAARA